MQGTTKRLFTSGMLLISAASYVQAEPLQPDPAWQQGTLANGFQWQVLATPQRPNDRIQIRLLVNSGSLAESTQQSGFSHFLPRIVLTGEPIPTAARWQQSMAAGQTPPPVVVSYDLTQYALSLPVQRDDSLKETLAWLARSVGQMQITPQRIDNALKGSDRVETWPADTKDSWWRYRLQGSALLGHDPAESLNHPVDPAALSAFYQQWYTPDAMTLVVVGNVDSRNLGEQISRIFGELKGKRETPMPVPTLSALKTTAVSIMSDKVTRDRLSLMWDSPWQPIRDVAAIQRYWRADLAREALFWHIQQGLNKNAANDVNLGFECRVLYQRAQCGMTIESANERLKPNTEMIGRELAKVRQDGLSQDEFDSLISQKNIELQTLFAAYARTQTPTLTAQRLRALQNQVVDIAPEQYQQLRQKFLSSITRDELNQELRQQLAQPIALVLLQPKGEPEVNMKELQQSWDTVTAVSQPAPPAQEEKGEVTDIPPA